MHYSHNNSIDNSYDSSHIYISRLDFYIACIGGYLGGKLYALNRAYLPMFMGVTMAASALLLKQLMNMDLDASGTSQLACPVLILSGQCCCYSCSCSCSCCYCHIVVIT